LSLLISYPEARQQFKSLRMVVVDEWHELLGSKRGVQTELGIARLRAMLPHLRVWGLSATLGNLPQARDVLLGTDHRGTIIHGQEPKQVTIETLLPDDIERFPWSGHIGLKLLQRVIEKIEQARSTLVFTNTRSQAEIWFRAILKARPDWAAELAVHHGSLDRQLRDYVETRLRSGDIRAVVCTSSLDLGVDFSPVDQVIQIGSPKGIARLLQRAGRSGHQPGGVSRIVCVPTHAFELVEYAAARAAAGRRALEGRQPWEKPLDVLAQHAITVALAEGFCPRELLAEVRGTYAYRNLTADEWQWVLDFVTHGGPTLKAYPQYAKLVWNGERFVPASLQVARQHRMTIGTIASDTTITVKFLSGGNLGTIEESFIARLREGEKFVFAGKTLQLVLCKDMTAYVRRAKGFSGTVPRWDGGKFPLSTELAKAVRAKLAGVVLPNATWDESDAAPTTTDAVVSASDWRDDADLEMQAVRPILDLQATWSRVPDMGELLIELAQAREGHLCYVYPFEGRSVNEGLASLVAYRMSRQEPRSITITTNDYGFELLSPQPFTFTRDDWRQLLSPDQLTEDLLSCLNSTELAKRQFRDIARVAGLVLAGYPGMGRTARQLQASSGLIFDVFNEYDPQNQLLAQARREVLEQQLESTRLQQALSRISAQQIAIIDLARLTPMAFPLWAARIQKSQVTSEKWSDRVSRMALRLEQQADKPNTKQRVRA
jgi:ATP-dependent Lhr-like helicase